MREAKKRPRKRRAPDPIHFPRPVVAPPAPGPEPTNGTKPITRPSVVDHLILRRDTGDAHGEERRVDHRHFPEYGLEKIPVNGEPHRVTLRGAWATFLRHLRFPRGTKPSLRRTP
jgi:hypothetical protein